MISTAHPQRKGTTPDFVLARVMTRPAATIYVVALLSFILAAAAFIWLIKPLFYWGGLSLAFGLMILCMILLLKTQAKTITIYLDDKSIFVNGQRYLKNQIAGLYSLPYDQRPRSRMSMILVLKNGRRLYLTDTDLFKRNDELKQQMHKSLLQAMQKRLGLRHTGTQKWSGLNYYAAD